MKALVVSYYTKGTPYEKEATDLVASCLKFHLDHEILPVPNLGSWSANCCYKPQFLLDQLDKHNRPLIWTDVDSTFVQAPLFFETCTSDLAIKINHALPNDAKSKILTGTFFINNTLTARNLLRFWKEECEIALKDNSLLFDQAVLAKVLFEKIPEIHITELPPSYIHIEGHPENIGAPVIIHTQASRLYQKIIDGEVTSSLTELLNSTDLKNLRK